MLTDKVLQTIEKHGMLSPGDKVVVAVSGGMDSVVLLHILQSLQERLGISLHVAHLNHGIRGKDADEDALFVQEFAEKFDLPVSVDKLDVPALAREWKMGIEAAARKVRYEFLDKVAQYVNASRIATAHTSSDQAETVLMNVLRGAGMEGLGGIPPVRGRIIRPLIAASRAEIEAYQKEHGLPYRVDVTNLQTDYTRNRIRLELLPTLREFNPRVDDALARLSETARDDNELLDRTARQAYEEIAERDSESVSFPLPHFADQPKAIQRRLLRLAASELLGSLVDIGFLHIENLLARLGEPGVYEVELPAGTARVRKTSDAVSVYLIQPEEEALVITPQRLDVPGQVELPKLGLVVKAAAAKGPVDWRRPRESMDVVIDADKIEGILTVRTWLPGDRIVPLGMNESKKLQDLFVDRKIPKTRRGRIPIICDEEKILWVAGVSLSQQAAVTPETRSFLQLAVYPIEQEIEPSQ